MNMKIARIKLGMTQKQLAEKIGSSPMTLVRIEKGDIDGIRLGTLKKIAEVLETTVQELFLK